MLFRSASIAAWNLGLLNISIEHAALAVEKEPENERLQKNFAFVTESTKIAAE
jgi:hypothetical protein